LSLHLAGMLAGWWSSQLLGMELIDRKAIIFAASQKTLPIGVLLATDPAIFGDAGVPFAIFPMLMYHSTQLIVDTLIAQRLAGLGADAIRT
jgi:sodium/bile acid cotransporter 7